MRSAKTLIRLRGCAGRSEVSLIAHVLLALSCAGSYDGCTQNAALVFLQRSKNNVYIDNHSYLQLSLCITKTSLFKYIETVTSKNRKFSDKNSNIFHISTQNIGCGYSLEPPRRGGSNEYPQSMFLNRNKKNNIYPCKPQFYCMKVGFVGVKII